MLAAVPRAVSRPAAGAFAAALLVAFLRCPVESNEVVDVQRVSSVLARHSIRVVDAEPADPLCMVDVELTHVPSAAWQSAWKKVAPRFKLDRARLVGSTMSLTFAVARLEALPRLLDEALAEANRLVQEQQGRVGDRDRRKKEYIDNLNQRLR